MLIGEFHKCVELRLCPTPICSSYTLIRNTYTLCVSASLSDGIKFNEGHMVDMVESFVVRVLFLEYGDALFRITCEEC